MSTPTKPTIGVILLTFGSATTSANVPQFLQAVYAKHGGAPADLIKDFAHRFDLVGGSRLVAITNRQAYALQTFLNCNFNGGFKVVAGMLYSPPSIDSAVSDLKKAGVKKIVGIIMSPQYSSFIMEGYHHALHQAAIAHDFQSSQITIAEPWYLEPDFISLLSKKLVTKKNSLQKKFGQPVPVVFTTHSLPKRVVDKDPGYLSQLQETIRALVSLSKLKSDEWHSAYQSAGHTPEEWLKPDLVDILSTLKASNQPAVLIVPIQFLSDHLEILYDLDVAARAQCQDYGISYHRTSMPNTHPLFIATLAKVVLRYAS